MKGIWSRVQQFFQGLSPTLEFIEILLYKACMCLKIYSRAGTAAKNLFLLCGLNNDKATRRNKEKGT